MLGVRQNQRRSQQQGFTLIEVMAALVIIGVMASVGIHRLGLVTSSSELTALQSAVRELNIRESLTWANLKLENEAWLGDVEVWKRMDTDLGSIYRWSPGPSTGGGTLHFHARFVSLTRAPSTASAAATWQ